MKAKGFTLVELLIAILIASLLMAAVYASVNLAQRSSSSMEKRVIAQQDVRGALDLMALEIRMASYNRDVNNINIWRGTDCISPSPNVDYKGIPAASANSITFEMDINDSGVIRDFANEVITYAYDAANLRITRDTNCGGAVSFLGDTAASGHRVVRVVNGDPTVNIPLFRYYDFNNIPIAAGQLPALIKDIGIIEITLVVETENIDPTINARKRLVYSSRVFPRNHRITPPKTS